MDDEEGDTREHRAAIAFARIEQRPLDQGERRRCGRAQGHGLAGRRVSADSAQGRADTSERGAAAQQIGPVPVERDCPLLAPQDVPLEPFGDDHYSAGAAIRDPSQRGVLRDRARDDFGLLKR